MYDDKIKTFLITADCGSFSKAAQALYLTPNAVKKRISEFEKESCILLFVRSNKGVSLTPAGHALYRDLNLLQSQMEKAFANAKMVQRRQSEITWVGMTQTFSELFLTAKYYDESKLPANTFVRLIQYDCSMRALEDALNDLGENIDLLIDLYEPERARQRDLLLKKTSSFRLFVGFPGKAPAKRLLSIPDLQGYAIALLPKGRSSTMDKLRKALRTQFAGIRITDIDNYHINNVRQYYENDICLAAAENQIGLYPYYSFLPLEDYTIEFGIYCRRSAPKAVREFIDCIQVPFLSS